MRKLNESIEKRSLQVSARKQRSKDRHELDVQIKHEKERLLLEDR